jgi:hypothetical protein
MTVVATRADPTNPRRVVLGRFGTIQRSCGGMALRRSATKRAAGYQRMKDRKPKNKPRSVQSILAIETIQPP